MNIELTLRNAPKSRQITYPMRGEMEAVVGDDGELEDWAEHELKAKRLSQADS